MKNSLLLLTLLPLLSFGQTRTNVSNWKQTISKGRYAVVQDAYISSDFNSDWENNVIYKNEKYITRRVGTSDCPNALMRGYYPDLFDVKMERWLSNSIITIVPERLESTIYYDVGYHYYGELVNLEDVFFADSYGDVDSNTQWSETIKRRQNNLVFKVIGYKMADEVFSNGQKISIPEEAWAPYPLTTSDVIPYSETYFDLKEMQRNAGSGDTLVIEKYGMHLSSEIAKLSRLKRLEVKYERFTDFDYYGNPYQNPLSSAIGKLTSLKELELSWCTGLPNVIGKLYNLEKLILNSPSSTWGIGEIGKISKLKELYIEFAENLTSLPPEIGQLSNLEKLTVKNCALGSLPLEIGQLTKLKYLDLWENQLKSIPSEIGNLAELEYLDLEYNRRLNSLPPEIFKLKNIETLNVADFGFEKAFPIIQKAMEYPDTITRLNLSGCKIYSLPFNIEFFSNLIHLDLSATGLTSLPMEIGQLTSLETLNLSSNELTYLPTEVGDLKSLKSLNLKNNKLTSIPQEIFRLKNLEELDLDYELSGFESAYFLIQKALVSPDTVSKLNLSGLDLAFIPSEIGQLRNIRHLDLSDNQLSELPSAIGQLTMLERLDLSYNSLTSLPAEIGQLSKLNILDLSNNQIPVLPPIIGQLGGLSELNISFNRLTTLPAVIGQLSKLQ